MKYFLSLMATLFAFNFSYAQNTAWPSTTSTDNVGIGTASPASFKLAITGPSIGTSAASLKLSVPGVATGEKSAISFFSTFEDNPDHGPRRSADIISGFNGGAWGSQYLAFNVGSNGASNDGELPTSEKMRIVNNGNVGIGTTSPSAKLQVAGNNSQYIAYFHNNTGATGAVPGVVVEAGTNNTDFIADFRNSIGASKLYIRGDGNVGIGTVAPDTKLAVNGTIHSKEVKVDLSVPAPDYVFDADYKLADLSELKIYLDQNHHLPEIPSASQMAKEGINLGDMNTKLLKKVEELTLYLIEKDKEIKEQREEINTLKQTQIINLFQQSQIDGLKQLLKTLTKEIRKKHNTNLITL